MTNTNGHMPPHADRPLKPQDLMSLEAYARARKDFRERIFAHKRRGALERLKGVESRCFVGVGTERFFAIADEDLERENEEKTSAVHFLRFELSVEARAALKAGAAIELGVDHPAYRHTVTLDGEASRSLAGDLG